MEIKINFLLRLFVTRNLMFGHIISIDNTEAKDIGYLSKNIIFVILIINLTN